MLLEDFDAKKYERTIREEGREEGHSLGLQEGLKRGEQALKKEREQGIRILINAYMELGVSKEQTIRKVMQEYSLTQEQAEAYYTATSR
jgi:hypothetical protein